MRTLYNTSKLETSIVAHFLELVDEADKDKNGKIDMSEWEFMGKLFLDIHVILDSKRR